MLSAKAVCLSLLVSVPLLLGTSIAANACACCADLGHRVELPDDKLEATEIQDLDGLKFTAAAKLRLTPAFPDDIHGFKPAVSGDYTIAVRRDAGRWLLDIKDNGGNAGTLSFPTPATVDRFEADFAPLEYQKDATAADAAPPPPAVTEPNAPSPVPAAEGKPAATDVDDPADLAKATTLIKEWRINAPVSGDGMFTLPKDARIRVILQGTGNACTTPDDFSHWQAVVLSADGEGQFTFLGRFE
jgi:hypothetical protein